MLEFRAGKMMLEGKRVVPDTRKGLIRVARVLSIKELSVIPIIFIFWVILVLYIMCLDNEIVIYFS